MLKFVDLQNKFLSLFTVFFLEISNVQDKEG